MPPKKRAPAKETKGKKEKNQKKNSWEIKILQELQKRQRREEALERELAATEKNYQVVENTWRKILRKIQTPVIKEDAEAVWRRFEHTMDIKNQVIALLQEAVDEEEEQRFQSEICHSDIIKQLLDLCVDRLTDLRERNKVLVEKLCSRGRMALREEMRRHSEDVEHQQVIAYTAEMTQIEHDLQREAETHARLDDVANRFAAQIQQSRTQLENELERIWHKIISVIAEYQKRTADLHKAYLKLKEKDNETTAEIHRYCERTKSLQLRIKKMQDKERKIKEKLASLDGLMEERKDFIHVYSRLRDYLRQDRKSDDEQLKDLVRQSNESLKWLSQIKKKGERILSLAERCRHLQTESETVIANEQLNLTEEMTDSFSKPGQETGLTHHQSSVEEAVEVCNKLANFWRRVGRAQITLNILADECRSLKAQNREFIIILVNYLREVQKSAASKQASNLHTAMKGLAIIEASHMYKRLIS